MADTQAEIRRVVREEQQSFIDEQRAIRDEQARARTDQERVMGDVARVLDSVREVAVAMARLEKRPVETEAPAATSEPHLPPPAPQYPSVPTPAPVTSHCELPTMPVPPHIRQTDSDQAETNRPRPFVQGESSCCHVH